jgi:hypothetical protein
MNKQSEKNKKHVVLIGESTLSARLHLALGGAGFHAVAPVVAPVAEPEPVAGSVGVSLRAGSAIGATMSDGELAPAYDVLPVESDFITVTFRALSAAVTRFSMEGLVIDFSRPGVLEKAASLLAGQTVYKNHSSWDVEAFLGAVSKSVWDAEGAEVEGVPGINAQLKIDTRIAPKIARGLLMSPPAINAVSVEVRFAFEYSHPRLAEEKSFWRNMGETIDGELVRLIATELASFGEISLVNQGADPFTRRLTDLDDATDESAADAPNDDEALTGNQRLAAHAATNTPARAEERTMKLAAATIAALGLSGDEQTDFQESAILAVMPGALAQGAQAKADATALLEAMREQTRSVALRVAALSHAGEGDAQLATTDALLINKADASELALLRTEYETKLSASLKGHCQNCGAVVTGLQSSVTGQRVDDDVDERVAHVNVY